MWRQVCLQPPLVCRRYQRSAYWADQAPCRWKPHQLRGVLLHGWELWHRDGARPSTSSLRW